MEAITLSNDYLKFQYENLSEEHRAIHDTNFNYYIKYEHDEELFVVDVDYVYPHIGFTRKDTCTNLLIDKYILDKDYIVINTDTKDKYIEDIHYKNLLHFDPKQDQVAKTHGGHNKDKYYLTVRTFKDIFMNSSTKNAKIFRSYYQQLERINHMYRKIQQDRVSYNEAYISHIRINHDMFIDRTKTNRVVYHVFLYEKTKELQKNNEIPNDKQLIKIGMTCAGLENRYQQLKSTYGDCIIINVFEVSYPDEFEKFLHKHPYISNLSYSINKSKEIFSVTLSEYKEIANICNVNWSMYNVYEEDNSNRIMNKLSYIERYIKNIHTYSNINIENDNQSVVTNLNSEITDYRTVPSNYGEPDLTSYVYILYNRIHTKLLVSYHPHTFSLEALKKYGVNITCNHEFLMKLSNEDILFKNHRVLVMEQRNYDTNLEYNINQHRKEYIDYDYLVIFKLNILGTKIIGEYSCLQEGANSEKIIKQAIDHHLHGKSSNAGKHVWKKLSDLLTTREGVELILEWRTYNDVVEGSVIGLKYMIHKLDSTTLNIVKSYISLTDVKQQENIQLSLKQINMSWNRRKTLHGYIWCRSCNYVPTNNHVKKVTTNVKPKLEQIEESSNANNIYSWLLYTHDGDFVKSFNSQMDIIRHMYLVLDILISATGLLSISADNKVVDDKYRILKKLKTDTTIPTTIPDASNKPYYSEKYKLIVKKNIHNTKILGIYNGWRDALSSEDCKFTETAICNAIRKQQKLNNKYWSYYGKTNQNLIDDYLQYNDLPKLFKMDKRGEVLLIHEDTKLIHKRYISLIETAICENIKDSTIINRNTTNKPYKGYFWKLKQSEETDDDIIMSIM